MRSTDLCEMLRKRYSPWARGKRTRCRRCDWLRPAESFWRLVLDYEPGAPHYGYYEPVVVWICEECERAGR